MNETVEAATRSALTPEEDVEPHTYALIYVGEDGLRTTLATSTQREDLVETKRVLTKLMSERVLAVKPMEIVAR